MRTRRYLLLSSSYLFFAFKYTFKNYYVLTTPMLIRRAIITEKVNICLTFYGPLPLPYFLLSKAEASCSPPPQVSKNCTLLDFWSCV